MVERGLVAKITSSAQIDGSVAKKGTIRKPYTDPVATPGFE